MSNRRVLVIIVFGNTETQERSFWQFKSFFHEHEHSIDEALCSANNLVNSEIGAMYNHDKKLVSVSITIQALD